MYDKPNCTVQNLIVRLHVLVTAGASGIGREIVRAFVANGAKVFVCDIDAKGLELLAQELPGLTTKICDVSQREDIERMVAFGVDALGGLEEARRSPRYRGPCSFPRFGCSEVDFWADASD